MNQRLADIVKKAFLKKEANYKTESINIHGREFNITTYDNGEIYINGIYPYDNAEHHWAYSNDNGKTFTIFIYSPGKFVSKMSGTKEQVAEKLWNLDKDIKSKIFWD